MTAASPISRMSTAAFTNPPSSMSRRARQRSSRMAPPPDSARWGGSFGPRPSVLVLCEHLFAFREQEGGRVETRIGGQLEPDDWPLEQLEREITGLAAHIHAATCQWLVLVSEFDSREGWAQWGCNSCSHWLSWRCALAPAAAREQLRVARRLRELPAIRAAFGQGEVSYSQVRALTRVATPELEQSLLEIARHATAAQLEVVLRAYKGVVRRELSPHDRAHGDRYVVCEHDEDGALLLRARLPAEEGALVVAALEAARASLRSRANDVHVGSASEPEGPPGGEPAGTEDGEVSCNGRGVSADPSLGPQGRLSDAEDVFPALAEAPAQAAAAPREAVAPLSEQAPVSNADALVLMAETLLSSGAAERTGGDSYRHRARRGGSVSPPGHRGSGRRSRRGTRRSGGGSRRSRGGGRRSGGGSLRSGAGSR